jgi:4-amino-4-deoxy-L-arabinose transferase-like glycosyltransferase
MANPNSMTPRPAHALAVGACLGTVLAALYLIPAATLGFWEPWETSLATLGRTLGEDPNAAMFHLLRDGEPLVRPWLETFLLRLGHAVGGEFGYRLPFALMNIGAALFAYAIFARVFGVLRALLAALAFGIAPAVVLSSASLAGNATSIAPITVATLALTAATFRNGEGRLWLLPVAGVACALSVWGHGVIGLAVPLGTLAVFAAGEQREAEPNERALGFAAAAALLAIFIGTPLAAMGDLGWAGIKDVFGVGAAVGLPLALLAASAPSSRVRLLLHPVAAPLALALFAALLAWPLSAYAGSNAWVDALLYRTPLNEQMLPDHVTFDQLIRLVGAAVYPMTLLIPLGFAYLVHSSRDDVRETLDDHDDGRALKQVLVLWTGVGFAVLGLSASLASTYLAPFILPLCASSALALTDERWLRQLSRNRIVFHTVGLASVLLLLMTSKDMRGTFDLELGRPGPHFFFEFLLLDGNVAFPSDYAFRFMSLFVLAWGAIVVLFFGNPRAQLADLLTLLRDAPAAATNPGRWRARWARLRTWVATSVVVRGLERLARGLDRVSRNGTRMGGTAAAVAFATVSVLWCVELVVHDVPTVTNHFSQKGLLTTFETLSDGEQPLYTAGIGANDQSYYMTGQELERLDRVADLRTLFCESEGAVFAVVPFDRLAEAHYEVRHAIGGRRGEVEDDENCAAGRDLFVVDGRSSRYVLVSNVLPEGVTDQSVIRAHVFDPGALPEDAQAPAEEVTVDGKLRLVAVDLSPRVIDSGDLTVAAYWEVLERPTANHEIFIHVDKGGNRLNGDHDPVGGHYPMRYWVPGEVVRDSFVIDVSRADSAGIYTAFYGFFRGDDRLVVDPPRGDNRVNLGQIEVR